ncbi:hypothetical protein Pen01_65500 [Phytomonospora endophytica]|nr:hypothetical protein Pen01_65500 [Phytomonospora endophytica]
MVPMKFGEVDVLVEAVPVAGSENTSALGKAGERVVDALDVADEVITEVASRVAGTVSKLAEEAARPSRIEVEFGLKFTVSGNVFVGSASGEAAMRVLVSYDIDRPAP